MLEWPLQAGPNLFRECSLGVLCGAVSFCLLSAWHNSPQTRDQSLMPGGGGGVGGHIPITHVPLSPSITAHSTGGYERKHRLLQLFYLLNLKITKAYTILYFRPEILFFALFYCFFLCLGSSSYSDSKSNPKYETSQLSLHQNSIPLKWIAWVKILFNLRMFNPVEA